MLGKRLSDEGSSSWYGHYCDCSRMQFKNYIVYTYRDASGKVRYVGKTSGIGTAQQYLIRGLQKVRMNS